MWYLKTLSSLQHIFSSLLNPHFPQIPQLFLWVTALPGSAWSRSWSFLAGHSPPLMWYLYCCANSIAFSERRAAGLDSTRGAAHCFVVPSSRKSRSGRALGMQPLAAPRRPLPLAPRSQRHSLISERGPCLLLCLHHIPTNQRRTVCLRVWLLALPRCLLLPLCPVSAYHSFPLAACFLPAEYPPFFSFASVWFYAFRIIGLQSYSQRINHVVPCHCLSSAHSCFPSLYASL